MPRSVRESPERRAWFEGMHDEEGNLKPMFAALAETEGKQGTFYFDDRVALRRGRVRLGNTEIDVGLFDYNANRRFDEEEDRLLLDLDGDQRLRFREDSLVFKLDDVFAINEKRYRLTYVDPYGRGFYMVEVEEEPTQQHLEEVREWMARAQVPVRKEGGARFDVLEDGPTDRFGRFASPRRLQGAIYFAQRVGGSGAAPAWPRFRRW